MIPQIPNWYREGDDCPLPKNRPSLSALNLDLALRPSGPCLREHPPVMHITFTIAKVNYNETWNIRRKLIIMAALGSRCGHYIFVLWFLLLPFYLLFSSPNLSGRRLHVYHTATHGACGLSAN